MALIDQNLEDVNESTGFSLLQNGEYELLIVDSEIKEGAKGDYILWTFEAIGYPNKIWDIMSLGHPVGLSRLKSLAIACEYDNPNHIADTEDFHGKTFIGKVGIKKDKNGEYDDKNVIKSFKPLNSLNDNSYDKNMMPWEQ